MNPLLVISLAIGLAMSQSSSDSFEAVYREGKEYVYNCESQFLTGLPKGSKIYSGVKIKATVRFQFTSATRVHMKVDKARWFKVNGHIDTADPTREMLPTELFKEINDPDIDRMNTELFKPCTFSYIRGHVHDLVTEDNDPLWSVNIKRGILSFLELNFNERQSLQSLDHPVNVEQSDLTPKFYRVVEPSVAGECETSYMVKPDITPDGQTLMNIMKVRNYDRCIERVSYYFDMFNGKLCDFCEPNTRFTPLTSQSAVKYNIVGSPSQYKIVNAYAESQFNFAPYSEKGGRITTYTNQTMTLMDSRPISSQISGPRSPKRQQKSVTAEHPSQQKSARQSQSSQRQQELKQMEMTENYKMVMKALTAFEKFSHDKVEAEVGPIMIELRRLLRTLDRSYLEKLLTEVNTDSMKNARKGLMDVLPVVGTLEGVQIIIDRLMKDDPILDCPRSVFMSLALMPRPDVPTIQTVLDFVGHKQFKDPIYKRAAFLSLGSLGYKMTMMNHTEEKETQKKQQLIQELKDKSNQKQVRRDLDQKLQQLRDQRLQNIASYNELRQKIIDLVLRFLKSPNPDDVILAIKTTGNLGFIELWPEVKAIIMNKEVPTFTRIQAIFCTRRMHLHIPDQVRRVLLPVYLNKKEKEDIRMAAYLTIMNTKPPRPDLEIIAHSVREEPSYNVGALVWANLMALSNRTTTCNCIQSLARNTTLALRYAKRYDWGLQYSNYVYLSAYDRDLQAGNSYEHALFFTTKERLPRWFGMQYNAAFLGQAADIMEVGMHAKGLDSYLDELSKEQGSTSLPDVLSALLKPRKPRSIRQSEQEIQEIKQKVKIEPRIPDTMEGHVYFKFFGQELVYFDINPHWRQQQESQESQESRSAESYPRYHPNMRQQDQSPVSSVASSLFDLLKTMRSVVYPLRHEMIITETGLPLWLRLDLLGAVKIDTDFRLQQPRSQPRSSQAPKEMVLDIKPSGLFQVHCEMGMDMKYFWTGTAIKADLHFNSPMLLAVNINPDKTKAIIRLKEEREMKPCKFETTPMTFIRHFPPEAHRYPVYPEFKEILVIEGVELTPFHYEYGKDWFGRIFSITGQRPVPRLYDVPMFPMNGKYFINTEYKPLNPTGLEIQIQHVSGSQQQSSAEQEQSSQQSGWWPFQSWFSSAEQERQRQQQASLEELRTSQQSSQESFSEESGSGFHNIEHKDLTIDVLKRKFEKVTKILKHANKCGFIVRVAEPGPNPVHEVQMSTYWQQDQPKVEQVYCVELRRAPIPNMENKPWKLVTDIRMMYPSSEVEPSDLLSNQYKQKLQKQVRMSFHHEGRQKDSLVDLDKLTLTQAVKQLQCLTQPSSEKTSVKDIVNHLMQQSQDSSSQELKEIIQKQRQLKKEVQELKKQPSDIKKRQQISQKYQELAGKAEIIIRKIQNKLEEIPMGQEEPEESAMTQSALVDIQSTLKDVSKIQKKIRAIQPPHEQISQQRKLDSLREQVRSARRKQEQHSAAKQSGELAKSRLEVEPQQRNVYSSLLDLEQQVILTAQKMQQYPGDLESIQPQLEKVVKRSQAAKDQLDETLIRDAKLDKRVRVKAFEIALKHKLISQDLEHEISKQQESLQSRESGTRKGIKQLQSKLKKVSAQLCRRVALAVNAEKQTSLSMAASQSAQNLMKTLKVCEVKQVQVIEQLQQLQGQSSDKQQQQSQQQQQQSDPRSTSKVKSLQKSVETIQEIQNDIEAVAQKQEDQQKREFSQESSAVPVLIKTLKVLSKQAVVVEKVRQALKQSKIQTAETQGQRALSSESQQAESQQSESLMSSSEFVQLQTIPRSFSQAVPKAFSHRELQKKVDSIEKQCIKLLKKINSRLSEKTQQEQDSIQSNRIQSGPQYTPQESARSLLEKLHKVQAKQLQQEDVMQSVSESIEQSQSSSDRSQQLQQLSHIYQVLSGMSQIQKSQAEIQDQLQMKVSQSQPQSSSSRQLQSVCSQLSDSLQQQKEKIFELEAKLRQKSRSQYQQDSSTQICLQKAQQLKDQIQRLCQDQARLEQNLQDQISSSARIQVESSESREFSESRESLKSQAKSSQGPEEIHGTVTMLYGHEGDTMHKIFLKVFGKKSLEQLIWEQQQSQLGEQDKLVQDYLEQKQHKNDKLASSYQQLKNKLNTYNHWHFLCAYEKENVAVGVRSLFWRTHEYLKYKFYPKASFMMPNKSNIPNNFEVVSEFRLDTRSMDMDLRTPYETTWFRNLHIPDGCMIFTGFNINTKTYYTHLMKRMTQQKIPATCEISSSRIKTLDQLRYEVPQLSANCKKILSMDCSPDSKYVVTSQPSKRDLSQKDITILTKNEKIEIVQEYSGPQVRVNSQSVDLSSPQTLRNEDGQKVSLKKSDKKVTVSIPKLSLQVSSDGKTAQVKVGQHYHSKACGLCGNLDSNPSNDLEGPQKTQYPDGSTVSAAYLVPDEQCQAEEIQQKMRVPHIRNQAKMISPVQQTKIIHKRQGYSDITCFSTQPVKRCPAKSSPEGMTSRLVSYHCLDSSSPSTQNLVRRSHSQILDELRYKTVDATAYESEPKACRRP